MPGGQYGPPLPGDRQPGTVAWQPAGRGADIRDKSAILGSKFVVTNQSGRVGDAGKKYGAEDQWNLQTVSDQVKSFEFAKDGCDRKSNFYLKEYDGSDPSDAAKEFFIYMNNRAGDKFQLCKDGKVLSIKKDENYSSVPSNETTSQLLAFTIDDAIRGTHKVRIRVYDPEANNDQKFNDDYFYDSFDMAVIDLADYRNTLKVATEDVPWPPIKNEVIQASAIGHFICEVFSFWNYKDDNLDLPENDRAFIGQGDFERYHSQGVIRECEIINEMLRIKILRNERRETEKLPPAMNGEITNRIYYYSLPNTGTLVINHYIKFRTINTKRYGNGNLVNCSIYIDKHLFIGK